MPNLLLFLLTLAGISILFYFWCLFAAARKKAIDQAVAEAIRAGKYPWPASDWNKERLDPRTLSLRHYLLGFSLALEDRQPTAKVEVEGGDLCAFSVAVLAGLFPVVNLFILTVCSPKVIAEGLDKVVRPLLRFINRDAPERN